jgi:hypothetical protein
LTTSINGLYQRHYSNYIGNIFDLKARLIVVKCKFNPVELSNIKLNDRIIIRDKKYTINSMKCDLITGEVDMELLSDYRTIGQVTIGARYSFEDFYQVDNTAQDLDVMLLTAEYDFIDLSTSFSSWITYDTSQVYNKNTVATITIAANGTGLERQGTIRGKWEKETGEIIDIEIPIIQNA